VFTDFKMNKFLSCKQALDVLSTHTKLSKLPDQITGNTVYVLGLSTGTQDQWKYDNYKWTSSCVRDLNLNKVAQFHSTHFVSEDDSNENLPCEEKFRKKVYILIEDQLTVIVHYLGDETKGLRATHTPRSILNKIDERVKNQTPSNVYREMICSEEGALTVKNKRQIRYRRQKILNELKLTHDDIYACYSIGINYPEFVRMMILLPRIVIICAHQAAIDSFNSLLKITTTHIVISYDTTFNLVDGYVSSLIYHHDGFIQQPSIVLAYMIHDVKQEQSHLHFCRVINDLCPQLHSKCLLISDNEKSFKNAFQKVFPDLIQMRCHNHLYRNIYRRTLKYRKADNNASAPKNLGEDDEQAQTMRTAQQQPPTTGNNQSNVFNDIFNGVFNNNQEHNDQRLDEYDSNVIDNYKFDLEIAELVDGVHHYIVMEHDYCGSTVQHQLSSPNQENTSEENITATDIILVPETRKETAREYKLKPTFDKLMVEKSLLTFLDTYDPRELIKKIKNLNIENNDLTLSEDDEDGILPAPHREERKPLSQLELSQALIHDDSVTYLRKKAVKTEMRIPVTQQEIKLNCSLLRKSTKAEAGIKKTGTKQPSVWDTEKQNKASNDSISKLSKKLVKQTTASSQKNVRRRAMANIENLLNETLESE
ncbi:unnamed protein product, partial [Didymodactylos carnosus]